MNGFTMAAIAALSLAMTGCATVPGAGSAAADAEEAPARPFIERSLVLAPESVGEFRLTELNDYPDHPPSGAGLRYVHAEFPDVLVNLFVYPVGRADRDVALVHGMTQLREELAAMSAQGRYQGLDYGEEVDFDLDTVGADGQASPSDPVPATGGGAGPDDVEAAFLAMAAKVEAAMDTSLGRRLSLSFTREDGPMNSAAFMFYRGLYLYKGRISAPATAMPAENFDRFANRAMALIVPVVEVRSTGGCANLSVNVDPGAGSEEMQQQLMRGLVESNTRAKNENCAAALDTSVPEGHRSQSLVYPASMWR
ncbi:hypothetical protein [Arenimonas donghaensis]|uniref:Lipoprotein n=1 Tax=Arenimonas donghaensis DSM 18148 = HO3-R19 TaxID=1121014 RepID=A0A087MKD4_9GAMM|nr:hypothetical protein [Arenimonas donghaensis]KFL37337.1 hypothetical protein N788_10075 [Arenimonas donghaensis DSM 18148 = HO3-R19]